MASPQSQLLKAVEAVDLDALVGPERGQEKTVRERGAGDAHARPGGSQPADDPRQRAAEQAGADDTEQKAAGQFPLAHPVERVVNRGQRGVGQHQSGREAAERQAGHQVSASRPQPRPPRAINLGGDGVAVHRSGQFISSTISPSGPLKKAEFER